MRDKSPTLNTEKTQTNDTDNQNDTPNNEEETLNIPQDPYKESVQQKIVRAELFWEIFQGKSRNEGNTHNAGSKNGGTTKGKGAGTQARKPKGGKE